MQSLMRSMSPQQRAELQSMMDALLRDDRLRWSTSPSSPRTSTCCCPAASATGYRSSGDEPLGLEGALAQIGRLQAMDAAGGRAGRRRVARRPRRRSTATRSRDLLGDDAVRDLDALDDLARRLEEAGYLTRDGERLELTPRGSRRIGQKVLDDLFARLQRDAFGGHRIDRGGRGGEREETTKPYEFGDPFHLDLRGTLFNALGRDGERAGARAPRRRPADPPRRRPTSRSTGPSS